MLAADKLLLTSTIRKNATELKGKELALHKARCPSLKLHSLPRFCCKCTRWCRATSTLSAHRQLCWPASPCSGDKSASLYETL